jgi:antitoxin component of MazEF toxin-antitoxin module
MGFPTKIQLINRTKSQQWYVNFPSACAQMMNFEKGEEVEWILTSEGDLLLKRKSSSK